MPNLPDESAREASRDAHSPTGFPGQMGPAVENASPVPEPPTPEVRRKAPLVVVIVIVGLLLIAGAGWLIYSQFFASSRLEQAFESCEGAKPIASLMEDLKDSDSSSDDLASESALSKYLDGVLSVEDSGHTLIVSTKSQEDDPVGVGSLALACVADELEVPTWVTESISTTRALDGRQTAEWDNFSAQWGYHPNSGLNLIIMQK